ncbi:MAG: hypothetical protein RL338_41 [Chloroflexota bacterium]
MSAVTPPVPAATARAERVRLDQLVVDRGLAGSRSRAEALVVAGLVRVGVGDAARTNHKPGDRLPADVAIALVERDPYVSRGAHKLAAALDAFGIDPAGLVCLDVGASTGGFTDLLLQRGAARVYALDVGRGQLAERLRRDPRVVVMERTNARTLTPGALPDPIALAVVDVSFISLALVLGPVLAQLGSDGGRIVPLVKPQFEAGRAAVRKGVVRDPGVHRDVLRRTVAVADALGLRVAGAIASPILGPEGNREFLLDLVAGTGGGRPVAIPDEMTLDDRIVELTPGVAA